MKVKISSDEWYPVYEIVTDKYYPFDKVVEMTESQIIEFTDVMQTFKDWQDLIRDMKDIRKK